MSKIFIVEDEVKIREELSSFLEKYNYECQTTDDFEHVVEHILASNTDLVLLDVNLPYFDGYYVCREIRKTSNVPIIIVTSRDSELDELMSMNLGADDFITKPYNTQILLAHIISVLKRSNQTSSLEEIKHNDVVLYFTKCLVKKGTSEVELSKNEMHILKILMENPGNIISRDDLMNELWQSDEFVDDNTLTVNINRLRKKLESIHAKDYITTKRGLGYMI